MLSGPASPPGIVNIFAIPSGKRLLQFGEHKNLVLATAFSPDGRLAATGGGSHKEIYLWEPGAGRIRHKLMGKGRAIWSVGFARDGTGLAWGKEPDYSTPNALIYRGLLQYRFQLRENNRPGRFYPTWGGGVKSEREYLRAIKAVGAVRIRTANGQIHPTLEIIENGQVRHRITRNPTDGNYHRSLTLTPGGRTVISGGSWGVLASYDVASGRKLERFIGHTGDVWALAPSPDGRFLVSGGVDQTVRLWEIESGRLLLNIFAVSDGANDNEWVAWTPAGYYTASPNGGRYIGWHINQGEDRLARYYPAERFAKQFRQPRVVSHYLATGGDLERAIALTNAGSPGQERVRETTAAEFFR